MSSLQTCHMSLKRLCTSFNGLVSADDVPRFAGKIYKESKQMVQLVEDIIKLSQLDETDQVPMEDVDLYRVAKSVLSSLSAKAKQRDIQLQLKGQPTHITGNPALIHSVLYNLSDNAITYNRDGGSVNITKQIRFLLMSKIRELVSQKKNKNAFLNASIASIRVAQEKLVERVWGFQLLNTL